MFLGMTLEDMNMYAGLRKLNILNDDDRKVDPKILNQDVSDLPKEFNWAHLLKPAFSQGKCGSCYAV